MIKLSYDEQTVASSNPATRLSHQYRLKLSSDIVSQHLPAEGSLLDFGAGGGRFLHGMKAVRPQATLRGIDAYVRPVFPGLTYLESLNDLEESSVHVVTALEVCEHLNGAELTSFLRGRPDPLAVGSDSDFGADHVRTCRALQGRE